MILRPPLRGVNDVLASSESPQDTTQRMKNMRGVDPVTKQFRLAMRSGLTKHLAAQPVGAYPVRALRSVSFHKKPVLYADKPSATSAPLGTADVKWSAITASGTPVPEMHIDRQGNLYSIDGRAAIEKRNSAGQLQFTISLPLGSSTAQVRALRLATIGFVDAPPDGTDAIFAGISEGGSQYDAKIWCYRQVGVKSDDGKPETKAELLWELSPDAYCERIKVVNGLMYTAQNEPDHGRSFVRVYFGLATTSTPELAFEFETPYPINDLDVRISDGAIITSHPPNLTRGRDPLHPDKTGVDLAKEFNLTDLPDLNQRLWCDLNARTLQLEDGDAVESWLDGGPGFRSIFQATAANQPIYVKDGINGFPAVRFNGGKTGASSSLASEFNPGTSAQVDDQQRTLVPAWTNNRWAMFIVCKLPIEGIIRPLFDQDNQNTAAGADCDKLLANKDSRSGAAATNPFGGKLSWLTTTATPGAAGGLWGGAGTNIPFSLDFGYSGTGGFALITIVHDGGASSGTDQAQHSTVRINGRPIDRYLSADQITLLNTSIGVRTFGTAMATFLQGDIGRVIVLRDYSTGGAQGNPVTGAYSTNAGAGNYHYPRTLGAMGASAAIAEENLAGNRYNDNEIERIEGMLAAEYGASHVLPCGTAAVLTLSANLAAADTVTIDGVVYTMVAALTGAAGEVLVGADGRSSLTNLYRAINNNGVPGTDYAASMVEHPTCMATCLNNEALATPRMKIETKGLATVAIAEASATATWNGGVVVTGVFATDTASIVAYMPGHYRHPFNFNYGHPRRDVSGVVGVLTESKGKMLNSTEGILARWTPNGEIAWVATSRLATVTPAATLPATDQKFGGIGYGCVFGTGTGIYTTGPMYSTAPATQSEQAILRRIVDATTSPTMTGTGTWALTSADLVGAGAASSPEYAYTRLAVDTFDNVYMPYYEVNAATGVMSLVCVNKTGGVEFDWTVNTGATNPGGLCCVIDPKLPTYDGDPATRAFGVYLGTRLGYTSDLAGQATIYRIEPVSVTALGTQPAQVRLCAISNGEFVTSLDGAAFLAPGGSGTLVGTQFDLTPTYVSMCSLFGEVFITDGRSYRVYNARQDKLSLMTAKTAGDLKTRARLVEAWRGRLVWARFADSPHEWLMSALGDPYDYDIAPPVVSPTQAVQGTRSPRGTGQCPDIVNGLCAFSDDTLIFFCKNSVYKLDGDPMDGGRFWLISPDAGGAFGRAWCRDEFGTVYFMSEQGAVYKYAPGSGITPMSEEIPNRLAAIDWSTHRCELTWSGKDQGFHAFIIQNTPTGEIREHYFWSRQLKGWYPDEINSTDLAPTCTVTGDGDSSPLRSVVIGCYDGYVRRFDADADDDDGVAIRAVALYGPLQPKEAYLETHFKELRGVLANGQGGCGYQGYATDTPDDLGPPVFAGQLGPGRNYSHFVQAVGAYVAIEVTNGEAGNRFAVESLDMDAFEAGLKTVRQ